MPEEAVAVETPIAEPAVEPVVEPTPSILTNIEDASKADEPTPDGEAKAETVPDEYTFVVPEGMEADTEMLAKYEPVFKDLKLSNEAAQNLVDIYSETKKAEMGAHQKAMEKQTVDWYAAVKADPELGGAKFEASTKAGQKVMAKYGTPALIEYLSVTGLGNHPELVRTFARIGAAMAEDVIHAGKAAGGEQLPMAKRLYPNSNMN